MNLDSYKHDLELARNRYFGAIDEQVSELRKERQAIDEKISLLLAEKTKMTGGPTVAVEKPKLPRTPRNPTGDVKARVTEAIAYIKDNGPTRAQDINKKFGKFKPSFNNAVRYHFDENALIKSGQGSNTVYSYPIL